MSHIKPEDAFDEMAALADVAEAVADPTEGDVIVLGDFNADCSYFRESDPHPFRTATYHWIIGDAVKTAVKTDCTYDRIVLRDGTFGSEYVPNSAQVFRFDDAFGLSDRAFVEDVSDHYPVFAEYRTTGPDDDGPAGAVAPAAVVAPAAAAQFVGSSRGQLYYLAGCNAARRLSPANLVTFASEQAAQQAGYRRSTAQGC